MTNAVFITSGIGNAIFLIPLIKTLSKDGPVDLICSSPFHSERVFNGFENLPIRSIKSFRKPWHLLQFIPHLFSRYNGIYIDYFGASRRNFFLAHFIGNCIYSNHIPTKLPSIVRRKTHFIAPEKGLHEATQYMRFKKEDFRDSDLSAAHFLLEPRQIKSRPLPEKYITIQPGAGNNKTPWKTWPIGKWLDLVALIHQRHPKIQMIVLGDEYDRSISGYFKHWSHTATDLIAETTMAELPMIIQGAVVHLGSDSGLLHIAGVVNTPSICIAGGSDPELFGWHKVNNKHKVIHHQLDCHPCYRWYLPNRSRVDHAGNCPDFKCIQSIEPAEVFEAIHQMLKKLD